MKREPKLFDANRGVKMDANYEQHARDCPQCQRFAPERPATAGLMCLEGSVLYKRDHPEKPRRPRVERDEHYATKGQIKAAMRYKGE